MLGVRSELFGVRSELARLLGVCSEFARSWPGVCSEYVRSCPGVDSELARSSFGDARSCLGASPGSPPIGRRHIFGRVVLENLAKQKFCLADSFDKRMFGRAREGIPTRRALPNKNFVWQPVPSFFDVSRVRSCDPVHPVCDVWGVKFIVFLVLGPSLAKQNLCLAGPGGSGCLPGLCQTSSCHRGLPNKIFVWQGFPRARG